MIAARWIAAAALAAGAAAAPGTARADRAGAIAARLEASYLRAGPPDAIALGVEARVMIDRRYAGRLVLRGGGTREGFAYHALVAPLGFAVRAGRTGDLGVLLGTGVTGATGTLELAVPAVVSAFAELEVTSRLRLGAFGHAAWLALAPSRRAALAGLDADELGAGLGLRIGRRRDEYNGHTAAGLRVSLEWTRSAAGDALALSLGLAFDAGWAATPAAFHSSSTARR